MKKYLNALKRSPLFLGINENEIESIFSCIMSETKTYEKNQFVLRLGDNVTSVGIVLKGSVSIIKEDFWGNRNLLAKVMPSGIFAETYALIPSSSLSVSVITDTPATILFLNVPRLLNPCSASCKFHSKLILNFMSVLAEKNLMLNEKLTHMSQRTTREKLLSYLSSEAAKSKNASFEIPFNRQQLADYLSVERSAMSLCLSKMRSEGLLDFKKNRFILYPHK